MQLEKIEISGFKSFADKTVIEFDSGVTAVVGPNGSGKSNLSEAIKWVLGEQSAKSLRGKKMDDIIFAGSQTRKPVNVAEVNLYINNEDGVLPIEQTQVVLTRRLNRNGDSSFLINKKAVRLKDITSLMMDSGLGKDSFALISQGKVEQIFNEKPEERRSIIEEAAGVLKYKDRKQQATRKLDQTQEHLDRIEDILHEIHGQLSPLEEQREKAIQYLAKKDELTEVETALLAVEIETIHARWNVVKQETTLIEQELKRISDEQQQAEQELEQKQLTHVDVEERVAQLQQQYVSLVQRVEQLDGDRKVLLQKQEYALHSDEENQATLSAVYEQQEQLEQDLKIQQNNKIEKELEHQRYQTEWQDLSSQLEQLTTGNEDAVASTRSHYIEQLQEETKLANQERYLEQSMEALQTKEDRLREQEAELTNEVQKVLEQQQEKVIIQEQLQEKQEALKPQLIDLQEELQQATQNKQQLGEQVAHKARDVQQLTANYNSLKHVSEDYAGYYQGVREILKKKQSLTGVIGSVAELIVVPDKLTTAIEIALGANSQFVVTRDETSAATAIAYLKERRLGRATFLPLSVIQAKELPKAVQQQVQQSAGFVGIASELVKTETTYQTIVRNLLGTTIVTETLAHAQQLARMLQFRYRIVSLEGDVVNAGGSMTGGSTKHTGASLVSRTTQLEQLQKQLDTAKQELAQLEQHYHQVANHHHETTQKFEQLKQTYQEYQQTLTETSLLLEHLEEQIRAKEKHQQAGIYELEQALQEYQHLEEEYIQVVASKKTVSQSVQQLKIQLENLQLSQEDRTNKITSLQARLQEVSTAKAVSEEQLTQLERLLRTIKQQQKQLVEQIHLLTHKQSQQDEDRQLDEQQLATLEQQLSMTTQELNTVEQTLEETKREKQELELAIKQLEVIRNKSIQQSQQLYKNQTKAEAKVSRFEVEMDQKLLYLNEEYGLTFEAAMEKTTLELSIEEASKLVRRLKQELEQLGPVNVMAIDEYDKVLERFNFLTEQQQDLIEAKKLLESTIEEMDDEVKRRFSDTFELIRVQFEKTFPRLFGGGRATLTLTNPDDLLTTGLDIIAQPPGKKLQSLSLLSGGERAFTAIALLFAILEVKPVPFCLLDEVEAALDESNVARYGRYLKEFTEQTQFIVITHRRGTMEEADVLYGVTMQDSGVSKLASVKFEDYEG